MQSPWEAETVFFQSYLKCSFECSVGCCPRGPASFSRFLKLSQVCLRSFEPPQTILCFCKRFRVSRSVLDCFRFLSSCHKFAQAVSSFLELPRVLLRSLDIFWVLSSLEFSRLRSSSLGARNVFEHPFLSLEHPLSLQSFRAHLRNVFKRSSGSWAGLCNVFERPNGSQAGLCGVWSSFHVFSRAGRHWVS